MKIILIIDDDQGIRRLAKRILESIGFEVIEASNGEDGIRIAQEVHPDIIMMDIYMPDMDGVETMRILKQEETLAKIPIIVVTSATSPDIQQQAEALGCDLYIIKPFLADEFGDAFRKYLKD